METLEYLKKSRLFSHLPQQLLDQIVPLAKLEDIPKGTTILLEGEPNDKVYFLLHGVVGIYAKGNLILELRRTGDIFGEMSIIGNKPCIASVIARSPIQVFSIQAKNIGKYTDIESCQLSHIFYRLFSMILTEKLFLTMSKAQLLGKYTKALEVSQGRFRLLYEKTPLMCYVNNQRGELLNISNRWLEVLGYHRSEVIGKNILNFLTKDSNQYVKETVSPLLVETGFAKDIPVQYVKKNGEILDAEVTAVLDLDDGEEFQYLAVIVDVTERNQAEARLRQTQKMEMLGILAGGVAHDFNNMLAAMLVNAEAGLMSLPKESEERRYLETILKTGERATNLVQQILTFSRMEQGRSQPVNLAILAQETLKIVQTNLPQTIELQQDLVEDCPIVMGDAVQFDQVLLNLCFNAIHAMEKTGGILKVTLRKMASTTLELIVSDTGSGIKPEHQRKVFDPFFTTKGVGKGTGLGLSVVRNVVEQHQGEISFKSQVGQGTAFSVYFPIFQKSIKKEGFQIQPSEVINRFQPELAVTSIMQGKHILIVEDEPAILNAYKVFLENQGYQITACNNGGHALKHFKNAPHQFNLVITDQSMPDMTGVQLVQEMLSIYPEIPILFSTGYSEEISEKEAQSLGVKQYLYKPVKLKNLLRAIEKYLQ